MIMNIITIVKNRSINLSPFTHRILYNKTIEELIETNPTNNIEIR